MTTLWGKRIGLRAFTDALTDLEIARVYRWSQDPQVLGWSGGMPSELTFHEFCERLRGEQRHPLDNRLAFFIVTRPADSTQSETLIGRIGIFAMDGNARTGELGIVISEPGAWSKNYGREAVAILLQHLFATTTLEHVNLFAFPGNVRAQRCFAACGFRSLGIARRFSPDLGEFDGVEMTITRHEFWAHQNSAAAIQILIEQDAK